MLELVYFSKLFLKNLNVGIGSFQPVETTTTKLKREANKTKKCIYTSLSQMCMFSMTLDSEIFCIIYAKHCFVNEEQMFGEYYRQYFRV